MRTGAGLADLIRRMVGPEVGVQLQLRDRAGSVLCDPNELGSALPSSASTPAAQCPEGGRLEIGTEQVHLSAADVSDGEAKLGRYVAISIADTG